MGTFPHPSATSFRSPPWTFPTTPSPAASRTPSPRCRSWRCSTWAPTGSTGAYHCSWPR
uniref:Uncharacterized protein n=1 Tax=Arundo donax TaxID=35708 RepID=A0A0A9H943_ARUDO